MNRHRADLGTHLTTPLRANLTAPRSPLATDRVGHIDFESLSTHEWRIVDTRQPGGSVEALVGFVARHDGAYYATRMQHPLESVPFGSLEAVAAFVQRSA